MNVTIICDRCGTTVEGTETPHFTGGFYNVIDGSWAQYARVGETKICDACMFTDPRYVQVYGKIPA
jgi:hypothetical protein